VRQKGKKSRRGKSKMRKIRIGKIKMFRSRNDKEDETQTEENEVGGDEIKYLLCFCRFLDCLRKGSEGH
jgi:hypothetical protein